MILLLQAIIYGDHDIPQAFGKLILPQRSRNLELLSRSRSNIYIFMTLSTTKKVYLGFIIKDKYA